MGGLRGGGNGGVSLRPLFDPRDRPVRQSVFVQEILQPAGDVVRPRLTGDGKLVHLRTAALVDAVDGLARGFPECSA